MTDIQQLGRPFPAATPLSRPFWNAAESGTLAIQRCRNCDRYEWTPLEACSTCYSETLEWTPVTGRGSVYSFSVVHRPAHPGFTAPYVVAIVELDEGVRMLTDLVNIEHDAIKIGMNVRVAFEKDAEMPLYHFEPERR